MGRPSNASDPDRSGAPTGLDAAAIEAGTARPNRAGEATRSGRKRLAIVDAATALFLREGYQGTSMEQIATVAAVSKRTVYKHVTDKKTLFTEIVLSTIDEAQERFNTLTLRLQDTNDIEADLAELARRYITIVMQPQLLQLRRIIIGESHRFPDVARTWYEQGPERVATTLGARFQQLAQRGLLHLDDPVVAAHHFNWLILSIPLNKVMFCSDETFTTADLERFADDGIRVFLAAYRQP